MVGPHVRAECAAPPRICASLSMTAGTTIARGRPSLNPAGKHGFAPTHRLRVGRGKGCADASCEKVFNVDEESVGRSIQPVAPWMPWPDQRLPDVRQGGGRCVQNRGLGLAVSRARIPHEVLQSVFGKRILQLRLQLRKGHAENCFWNHPWNPRRRLGSAVVVHVHSECVHGRGASCASVCFVCKVALLGRGC